MLNESFVFDISFAKQLEEHYAIAGPYMERLSGGIPFVWSTLPGGLRGPTIYHGPLSPKTKPKAPVVDVATKHGIERYPALSAERITGLVAHGAIEVYSWSPTVKDPTRARFGRLLANVADPGDFAGDDLEDGITLIEAILKERNLDSIRVYDGGAGCAVWIPFADAPAYEELRVWLHGLCNEAVRRAPKTVTTVPDTHGGAPVHLHVESNAVGRFSVLPYSVRGWETFPVAMPIDVSQLAEIDVPFFNGAVTVDNFAQWTNKYGDVFSTRQPAFWTQTFASVAHRQSGSTHNVILSVAPEGREVERQALLTTAKSHGPIISAAIAVLQDGHSHTAEEILALAEQQHLLDPATTHKYVYTSLIEYIARANGNGRKPAIVQNADRSFRINEPPDEWPELEEPPAPALSPAIQAIIDRLTTSASGSNPTAFELAVCDAFSALGFTTTHVGGQKNPDGYADAPLGTLGYRFTIECKSADEGINDPSVFEAAKFKEPFNAQFCALVARAFTGEIEFTKELHNHGVSAWTIDDLATLLRIGANPLEIEPLFAPGFAADGLNDLVWERRHGRAKRVRLIADAIVRTGWTTQLAYHGDPAQAPHLTEDVAMVLVNQDLAAQGSSATCDRDDVRAAIDYLSNPLTCSVTAQGNEFIILSSD
jgi:DNA primase